MTLLASEIEGICLGAVDPARHIGELRHSLKKQPHNVRVPLQSSMSFFFFCYTLKKVTNDRINRRSQIDLVASDEEDANAVLALVEDHLAGARARHIEQGSHRVRQTHLHRGAQWRVAVIVLQEEICLRAAVS
jgi:hypothetical protein